MLRLFIFLSLLVSVHTFAQVNPSRLDSFRRSVDADNRRMHHWQDSFTHNEDSLLHARLKTQVKVQTRQEQDTGEGIGAWIYLPVITGISGIIILLALRNRKKKKQD